MSDPLLSEIDFKNKIVCVWTTLKIYTSWAHSILKTFPRQQQLKTEKKKLLLKDLKQLRKTKLEDRKKVKEALTLLIERHRDHRTARSAIWNDVIFIDPRPVLYTFLNFVLVRVSWNSVHSSMDPWQDKRIMNSISKMFLVLSQM